MPGVSLTYSLADQSFARTKSLGILDFSLQLLRALVARPEVSRLSLLSNRSLSDRLGLGSDVTTTFHDRAATGYAGRIWWDQWGVYSAARRAGHPWLVLPKGFASFVRPCPVRLAVFVHDLMQAHYDRRYPGLVPGLEATYFRRAMRASLRSAEVVFTQTEFVKQEIEHFARSKGWSLPRLVCSGRGITPPAGSAATARRDLVVMASRLPHKLTRVAVDYLSRWQQRSPFTEGTHWVGSWPEGLPLPAFSGWQRHARMPEAEFRGLMARARAVLFFSEYEGFGMPPVEAVLAGACPVYSDISATREVMAGCGYPFDNDSYDSFAAALDRALTIRPPQLRYWGDELAGRHNWDDTTGRVLQALSG
jgi:glycosyltransferase involved in cell wall biosynthesis